MQEISVAKQKPLRSNEREALNAAIYIYILCLCAYDKYPLRAPLSIKPHIAFLKHINRDGPSSDESLGFTGIEQKFGQVQDSLRRIFLLDKLSGWNIMEARPQPPRLEVHKTKS